jgi:hypothetical protein
MIGYGVNEAKKLFFDRPKIMDAATKATRKVLSKFGAFVMTSARQSIRNTKGPSAPGQPPHSRTGLLKKFLFFGYDPARASVVIGPVKLTKDLSPDGKTIPQLLEEGGKAAFHTKFAKNRRARAYTLAPRPFMGPALKVNLPQLPDMWRDSIT